MKIISVCYSVTCSVSLWLQNKLSSLTEIESCVGDCSICCSVNLFLLLSGCELQKVKKGSKSRVLSPKPQKSVDSKSIETVTTGDTQSVLPEQPTENDIEKKLVSSFCYLHCFLSICSVLHLGSSPVREWDLLVILIVIIIIILTRKSAHKSPPLPGACKVAACRTSFVRPPAIAAGGKMRTNDRTC